MRRKVVLVGIAVKSYALAGKLFTELTGVPICSRHIERLTEEIGKELCTQRDDAVEEHRHLRLKPAVETTPSLAVAEVDGGRVQKRAEGHGPGVHEPCWGESKVANLQTMQGETYASDPQPEPPAVFLEPVKVAALAAGLHGYGVAAGPEMQGKHAAEPADEEAVLDQMEAAGREQEASAWQPQRLVRTCVATMSDSEEFGAMVAAEAQRRNFYAAPRGAFVADGQKYNWSIQRRWFRDFVAITDFLHVLGYVYAAAQAAGGSAVEQWQRYESWLRACWQGRVAEVIGALTAERARLGEVAPEEQPPLTDPRLVVDRALTYLSNNQERMDYPRYRQQGLPITSALIESLIKEFNYRLKGSEKFWNPSDAEKVLQVCAAFLSEDDRLSKYLSTRPGQAYRRQPHRRAA